MNAPDELRDGSRAAGWLNKLLSFVKMTRLVEGVGYRLIQTTRGTALEIQPGKGGGGSTLKHYRVKGIEGDFMTCREYDGTTEGETDIYIARDPELRRSKFEGQSIAYSSDGDVFTASFTYSSNTKRVKIVSGVAETQVIIPYYKTDFTVILAAESENKSGVTDPDESDIYITEVTQRAWARTTA